MPRISHEIFENKGSKRSVIRRMCRLAAKQPIYDKFWELVGRNGTNDGNQDGAQNGAQRGVQDGVQHGHQDGNHDGFQDGAHNGSHNGAHDRKHDGHQHGAHDGAQNGASDACDSFRIFRVGNTFIDLEPGERPPADAKAHAQALLVFLQADPKIPGNWVSRSLLVKIYLGPLLETAGWPPENWHTVAHHFIKLPGVRWRQKDNRKGWDRKGPSPREYRIPRPKAAVVDLAGEKRNRACLV